MNDSKQLPLFLHGEVSQLSTSEENQKTNFVMIHVSLIGTGRLFKDKGPSIFNFDTWGLKQLFFLIQRS